MTGSIRTFVAVHIPETSRERIPAFLAPFRRMDADVKWVHPENLHLTLKFLGDVSPDRIRPIEDALGAAVSGVASFEMALAGTGCFPNARRPAVLWIGATEGAASLVRLAEAVDGALGALGFEREKRAFSAHLTIGRVRSPRNVSAVVDAMALAGFADGPFRIDAVHLMKSDLLRTGAVYTTLRTFKLQG